MILDIIAYTLLALLFLGAIGLIIIGLIDPEVRKNIK